MVRDTIQVGFGVLKAAIPRPVGGAELGKAKQVDTRAEATRGDTDNANDSFLAAAAVTQRASYKWNALAVHEAWPVSCVAFI